MSGHTPGPWKAWQRDADKGSNYWLIRTANEKTGLDDTIRGYCGESNARLIAESPALLAFSKWAMGQFCGDSGTGESHWEQFKEFRDGQSAIAKAEGKQ